MKALFCALLSAVTFARGGAAAVAGSATPPPTPLWETAAESILVHGALSEIPPGLRARAEECSGRAARFRPRLPPPGGPEGPEFWTAEKKRGLERDLVAFVSTPGIEDTAAAYAGRATLAYEWEGMADGPLAEAAFAKAYMESRPETPLAPYLALFLAHRYRCAFEILERGGDARGREDAARSYRSALRLALGADDPLIRFIADDMDGRPYLYLPAGRPPALETQPESAAAPCPESAFPGAITDPRAWALECFEVSAGPDAARPGSIAEIHADIDGDGADEILIGSAVDRGNAGGTHYVFHAGGPAFRYLGSVFLHPDAWKPLGPGLDGNPSLLRYRRLGPAEGLLETVVYDGRAFIVRSSEKVDAAGRDRARLCALLGISCESDSAAAATGTILTLRAALDLADAHVRNARIGLDAQHLRSAALRYDEAARASYWHLQWAWSTPRIGGEFGLRVYMNGRIVEARLGP
jgi:hypothetical protein